MKLTPFLIIFLLAITTAFAQQPTAADALKPDNQTLRERYNLMKNRSEVYQDYNVIRRNILDGMWSIVEDSIAARQATINQAQAEISRLNQELEAKAAALQAKEDSMKDIEHASTHITVLGIDFTKSFFSGLVAVLLLLAALAVGVIVYYMKIMRRELAEKEDLVNTTSQEFEEYRRKAMEKQTKLSRELQDERNKLQELGSL